MKKTITIVLAASTMAIGGTAVAQDRNVDLTRAEAQQRAAERFARMDANGDGVINAADREARARARFAEADANGDGLLSFAEMQDAREERRATRQERRGDRMGRRGGRRGGGEMRQRMMSRADSDGDGAISRAEMTAAALARFDRMDADDNGVVTAEERRAQRGERRGRRGDRAG